MFRTAPRLLIVTALLFAATLAFASPTTDLLAAIRNLPPAALANAPLADYLVYTLTFDEASASYHNVARWHGAVQLVYDASVTRTTRLYTEELVVRINAIIEPYASLVFTEQTQKVVVCEGLAGRQRFASRAGRRLPSDAFGYNLAFGTSRLTHGVIWVDSPPTDDFTRSIYAQELTQVLGCVADAEGGLWADGVDFALWLNDREQIALRVLYALFEGGENAVTTRRIVDTFCRQYAIALAKVGL